MMTETNGTAFIVLEPEDFIVVHEPSPAFDLSCLASDNYESYEAEIVRLTNEARADHHLPALTESSFLMQSALAQALDMAEHRFISHVGSDGSRITDRVTRTGYRWLAVGENLAMGQLSPDEAVQGWMNSPGHRANVLNNTFVEIGVAYIEGDIVASDGTVWRGGYWVQNFGTPRSPRQLAATTSHLVRSAITHLTNTPKDDPGIVIIE